MFAWQLLNVSLSHVHNFENIKSKAMNMIRIDKKKKKKKWGYFKLFNDTSFEQNVFMKVINQMMDWDHVQLLG